MGASRQSQNIFYYIKKKEYKSAWYWIKHWDKLTYDDTVGPIICKVKGHVYYQPDPEWEPEQYACKRCHRYVDYNPRKEKLLRLKKLIKKQK